MEIVVVVVEWGSFFLQRFEILHLMKCFEVNRGFHGFDVLGQIEGNRLEDVGSKLYEVGGMLHFFQTGAT